MDQGPGWMMLFGGIQILFWLVVAAGVALLVVWAIRSSTQRTLPAAPTAGGPQRETPLDILARRFASGEITAEEYERGRDLLGGSGRSS
jgi:putative membrane protein